jgi:dihydropteroate synthase type 2
MLRIPMVRTFGILNITRDSFSDGGRFLEPAAAVARGRELLQDGADVLDLGAESTHPDAEDVSVAEAIARLLPVVAELRAAGARISIDTARPPVMQAMAAAGVDWLNDVGGMRDPAAVRAAAASRCGIVVMYARTSRARAERSPAGADGLLAEQVAFFVGRLAALERAGVGRDRVVLDPGMGFFLGSGPAPSLRTLRHLRELQALGQPLLVSVSRKSFLGAITGRPVGERGPATLAAELWAVAQGVDWIRTHDVRALRDALAVTAAIRGAEALP